MRNQAIILWTDLKARRELAIFGILGLFAYVWVLSAWISDDAYISFRVIQNFTQTATQTYQPPLPLHSIRMMARETLQSQNPCQRSLKSLAYRILNSSAFQLRMAFLSPHKYTNPEILIRIKNTLLFLRFMVVLPRQKCQIHGMRATSNKYY